MPCLLALVALVFPRLVLLLVWVFSNLLQNAYQTSLWPVLGFFFMPLTTLTYAWAMRANGGVSGGFLALYVLAAFIDLGLIGGASRRRKRRRGRRG